MSAQGWEPIGPYGSLRPWLFKLDPEQAHGLSLRALQVAGAMGWSRAAVRALLAPTPRPVTVAGLRFPHAVGLAAGYDKNAAAVRGLASMGFGHIEVGTVTPRPQAGQARPRVFRRAARAGLINRMGFPNEGMEVVRRRLDRYRQHTAPGQGALIGVNLGKNKDTDNRDAPRDYQLGVACLGPLADHLIINVSSPNTPGLRALQSAQALRPLLEAALGERERLPRRVPLLVKLSPDMQQEALLATLELLVELGVEGVVATNTTSVQEPERGGLSGAPLRARAAERLALIRQAAPELALVACGGIGQDGDLDRYLDLGASLVQVWTALVYRGPALLRAL